MRPEQRLYERIKKGMPWVHWQRFEDTLSSGIPDLNGCYQGVEVWIEAKVAKPSGKVAMRPAQVAWLTQRWASGGRAWILVERGDRLRAWQGGYALSLSTYGWDGVEPQAEWPARRTTPWDEVWQTLARPS